MNRKHVYLAGLFATALLFAACDKDNNENDVNAQDEAFIVATSKSNRAEVALGTIALEKGSNPSVKTYAQMMRTEHTNAETELQNIVNNADTDASMTDSLDADQIAMRTMLLSLPAGPEFDSVYIDGQIKSHVKTLGIFDAEISGGQHAQIKNFATSKRPSIQMHKNMADSIFLLVR